MIPVLVGLDYRTAPLELREQLQAHGNRIAPLLATLRRGPLHEIVVLSTCNRYEIFATCDDPIQAQELITDTLLSMQDGPEQPLLDTLYRREGIMVVRHLFRVAAGLESLVLGETQIMRQLATAHAQAHDTETSGAVLNRLFTAALHAGKRARTETAISQHTLSVSHAAVQLAQRELAGVDAPHIVVLGAGEMAALAANALVQYRVGGEARTITIINRSEECAQALASQLGVDAQLWEALPQVLADSDAVIAATGAYQPILRVDEIAASRTDPAQPLLLVDIGVPRNIAPATSPAPAMRLYDIDNLQAVVAQHRALREAEIAQVEEIIGEEVATYSSWLKSRRIVPVLTDLRGHADAIAEAELERALRRLPDLDAHEREVIAQMAQRIVNKLMHTPTVTLKLRAARSDHFDYDHAIRKLFALDPTQRSPETDSDDD